MLFCRITGRKTNRTMADSSGRAAAGGSRSQLIWWLVLVFIPSSWLMGVTTYLTTDLAAIPLLWVIPLVIYLLSFILAFAHSGARVVIW